MKAFYSLLITFLFVLVLYGINATICFIRYGVSSVDPLVYEPYSSFHYQTNEIDFLRQTNRYGLRDKDETGMHCDQSIVCIGDSWTMGWGVSEQFSWPKQLEEILSGENKVEVINGGQGGIAFKNYYVHAQRILSRTKANKLIIGILLLDDLQQVVSSGDIDRPLKFSFIKKTKYYLDRHFGQLYQWIKDHHIDSIEMRQQNQIQVGHFLRHATSDQLQSFAQLPDTVKKQFESGNLNPGLINTLIKNSDGPRNFLSMTGEKFHKSIRYFEHWLQAMKKLGDHHDVEILMVLLPQSHQVGHCGLFNDLLSDGSFSELNTKFEKSIIKLIRDQDIRAHSVSDLFLSTPNNTDYFYYYDGHPTALGYRLIAEGIAPIL